MLNVTHNTAVRFHLIKLSTFKRLTSDDIFECLVLLIDAYTVCILDRMTLISTFSIISSPKACKCELTIHKLSQRHLIQNSFTGF